MDPLDKNKKTKDPSGKEVTEWQNFQRIVGKLRRAVASWVPPVLMTLDGHHEKVLVDEAYHGTIDTLSEYVLQNKTANGWGREHTGIFVPDRNGGTEDIGSIIGGVLVCDAVTIHDSETKRLDRVLAEVPPPNP